MPDTVRDRFEILKAYVCDNFYGHTPFFSDIRRPITADEEQALQQALQHFDAGFRTIKEAFSRVHSGQD